MDKKLAKRIFVVIMGICAVTLLFACVSLIVNAVGISDMLEHANTSYSVMLFEKWSAVAVVMLLITLFTSYVFSCISKNKIFKISSAALSLFTAISAISFICVLRKDILDAEWSTNDYALYTAYIEELVRVIIPCLIGTAYFTMNSVLSFKKAKVETDNKDEANNEEVQ
ncbi:MAG: hypothetical protein HDT36_04720 [Clostridiales bacterium]|nr:hypothetical protein [Clostridiales bacterium]